MLWTQSVSFVLGLIASIVGWWIIAVLLIPRLEVSELKPNSAAQR